MKYVWYGTMHNGHFVPDYPGEYLAHCQTLNDSRCDLTVVKHRKHRSNNQLRYYFGVVVKICGDFFGYSADEMHDCLKWQFLRKHSDGKPDTCMSTKDLTTEAMEVYLSQIRQWASINYSIQVPQPNEVDYA